VAQIKKHVDSFTAVLILANGTLPRVTAGTKCALSILSAIFPNTVTNNVVLLLTHVSSPIYLNFPEHDLPEFLKAAPHFLLDNPIALQREYLKMKDRPNKWMRKANIHEIVYAIEQNALEMLVNFFDRLDCLEPQSTANIVSFYKEPQYIARILALMEAAAAKMAMNFSVSFHPTSSLGSNLCAVNDMNTLSNFPKSIPAPALKQRPASNTGYLCTALDSYSTCPPQPPLVPVWVANMVRLDQPSESTQPYPRHCHTRSRGDLGSVRSDTVEESPRILEHPAGPFAPVGPSICVEEAAQRWKQEYKDTEEEPVGQYQLERVQDILGRALDLLGKAKERMRKGIQNVKRIFQCVQ